MELRQVEIKMDDAVAQQEEVHPVFSCLILVDC